MCMCINKVQRAVEVRGAPHCLLLVPVKGQEVNRKLTLNIKNRANWSRKKECNKKEGRKDGTEKRAQEAERG